MFIVVLPTAHQDKQGLGLLEKLSDMPRITLLESDRAKIQTLVS